jgi:hypothetical protein
MACAEHLELAVVSDQMLDLRDRLRMMQSAGAEGDVARPVSHCLDHHGVSVDCVMRVVATARKWLAVPAASVLV